MINLLGINLFYVEFNNLHEREYIRIYNKLFVTLYELRNHKQLQC